MWLETSVSYKLNSVELRGKKKKAGAGIASSLWLLLYNSHCCADGLQEPLVNFNLYTSIIFISINVL